jgi:hypothetical protein
MCVALLLGPAAATATDDSLPAVELQAVLSRDTIEQNDRVTLFLFLANKSRVPLTWNNIEILPNGFREQSRQIIVPTLVGPYETVHGSIDLIPDSAPFGTQKIIVSTKYIWTGGTQENVSTQTVALPITLTRRFEEEAKGFPGGSAAFLYLLLPVIPFLLSYQFFEGLRKGEGAKLPEFKAEYIAPAFLAAIVVSFLFLVARNTINYSAPRVFVGVLFGSGLFGAMIPVGRWAYAGVQRLRWGYKKSDAPATYLRKALLSPYNPESRRAWVTGQNSGATWQGFHLKQPNGKTVLGPQVSVSPADLVKGAFNDGKLIDAKLLVASLKKPGVTVRMSESITQDDEPVVVEQGVAIAEFSDFSITSRATSKELVLKT